jgi:hypothetical protein
MKEGGFDPATFGKYLGDRQEAVDVFFKGPALWQLNGLQNIVAQVVGKSGGQQLLLKGAALALPGSAGKLALIASFAKPLMLTTWGQKFLIGASQMKPGTVALQNLVSTAMKRISIGTNAAVAQHVASRGLVPAPVQPAR